MLESILIVICSSVCACVADVKEPEHTTCWKKTDWGMYIAAGPVGVSDSQAVDTMQTECTPGDQGDQCSIHLSTKS